MSIEARQIQETLCSYAAILNFTPSPQVLRAKFGAFSVQNAQLLPSSSWYDRSRHPQLCLFCAPQSNTSQQQPKPRTEDSTLQYIHLPGIVL